MVKTVGGHRRITVQEVLRFVREQNHSIVEPQLLALPSTQDRKARRIGGCAERLAKGLLAGNEDTCRAIVFDLFIAGQPVSRIFDEVVAPAFRTIGEKWECREAEIWQERSSCQIAIRVLHDLRSKLTPPKSDRAVLGATIEGDLYSLPGTMAEIVLRSMGWDARLLGQSIPFESMSNAIEQHEPVIFWLSVSHIPSESAFVTGFQRLFQVASDANTAIVVGGRALTPELRSQLRYAAFCDTMQHLEEFARTQLRQSDVPATKSRKKPKVH